jgi:2-oxoglutarate dehydrogenase E1 component
MTHGHFKADLDPLQLSKVYASDVSAKFLLPSEEFVKLLRIEHYGFTEADLDKKFYVSVPHWGGLLGQKGEWTLREIVGALEKAYCGKIGVEYMHIPSRTQCNWIREKFEMHQFKPLSKEEKLLLLDRTYWCDEFAQFIT